MTDGHQDERPDETADEVDARLDAPGQNVRDWPPWAMAVVEAMRSIPTSQPTIVEAARLSGVNRSTINRLIQRDESFAVAVEQARREGLATLEQTAILRARTGQPLTKTVTRTFKDGSVETIVTEEKHVSDNLLMFYLKRWMPEYRDSYRIEQSGPNGGPIKMDLETRITDAVGLFEAEVVRLSADRDEGDDPRSNGGSSGHNGS